MKLLPANQASRGKLEGFVHDHEGIDRDLLLEKGYVVLLQEKIEGCFVLDTLEEDVYWLKQLYVTKNAAISLPALIEAVLALAKRKEAKEVFVHSHQPMVDQLLEALQFYPQKDTKIVDKYPIEKGKWWTYSVS
ncbi:GNAT family N-acetyltransferase [Oceanobacillus halotolerans]|uniref:hypothetical protein n=1 Tax=Oceanobacillus halotolerans TaxID=2663380 RepID=UPI0013DCEE73|nr:hypothetical protein [Oceanobacillus halotolerans]